MVSEQGARLALHFAHKMASLGIGRANVGVALSGGADSLSLALALSWWSGASGQLTQSLRFTCLPFQQDQIAPTVLPVYYRQNS